MDRRVTPPKRVTSPTWSPSPPCKQALVVLKMKRVSVNNSSEGEGYTSEIWPSTLESNGLLAQSQREVTQTDAITNSYRRSLVRSLLLFFTSDFSTGEFGLSKSLLEIFMVISGETMCRSGDLRFACLRDVRHSNMAEGEIVLTLRSICQKSTKGPKQIKLQKVKTIL